MRLALCASCCRHVKVTEVCCPFCGARLPSLDSAPRTLAAAVLLGLGLAAASCGGSADGNEGDASAGGSTAAAGGSGGGGSSPAAGGQVAAGGHVAGGHLEAGGHVNSGGRTDGRGGNFVVLYGPAPLQTGGRIDHGAGGSGDRGSGGDRAVPLYAPVPLPDAGSGEEPNRPVPLYAAVPIVSDERTV